MRIAMFSETYLPSANGVTTSIVTARRELRKRGHEVRVLAAGPRRTQVEDALFYGGRSMARYPDFHLALAPAFGNPGPSRYLRRTGTDLAHLHSPGPMGWRGWNAARRNGIPYVYTYHTHLEPLAKYAPRGGGFAVSRTTTAIQDFLVRRASALLVPSHFLLRLLRAENEKLARGAIVVPTGIDVQRFNPAVSGRRVREAWNLPDGAQALLYLGRLGLEKRVDFLIDSFRAVAQRRPDAHLVLAGRGPARPQLEEQVRQSGLAGRVTFAGFVPEADLPHTYAAADAFVSASDFETQGLTLLEAMATGLPSAVAAAGGYLDPIHDGDNGFLFAPHDTAAAARAMERALDAPQRLRGEARAMAESYRLERCIRVLERTYEASVAGVPVDAHHVVPVPGLPG